MMNAKALKYERENWKYPCKVVRAVGDVRKSWAIHINATKIFRNTEQAPSDLRKLVTQIPAMSTGYRCHEDS